ncbi:MAG TPA: hydroxyacylglutathione hydrolase [Stellaceae bacterium]|jgi:hydroxyacylglutathione hydrolase|nr:hydroxyacylglutathione hydrolase [Stellaceae bacterium]
MSELVIRQIPVLKDNYVYLVHEPQSGLTAAVDPSVAPPILDAAQREGWRITHILNTHHHNDHTGGNREIKEATGCVIVGPRADHDRIPGIDLDVGDGDTYEFGTEKAKVFDVPGHTRGHIAYWFGNSRALFCGDTLFLMGCGRVFEGTHAQMWNSLSKLKVLPPETRVYCAHEYTQNNARFALTVEPENRDLVARAAMIDELRAHGQSTVPATLAEELKTNPFLRADLPALQQAAGTPGDAVATFASIRTRKDKF